jgi:hypothetical protein
MFTATTGEPGAIERILRSALRIAMLRCGSRNTHLLAIQLQMRTATAMSGVPSMPRIVAAVREHGVRNEGYAAPR